MTTLDLLNLNLENFIKFLRGTEAGYQKMVAAGKVDKDTLYFVYENADATVGKLYLGEKLIASGDAGDISVSLKDLTGVEIPDQMPAGEQLLVFDPTANDGEGAWVPRTLADVVADLTETPAVNVMTGATDSADGEIGLVPKPVAGQQDAVLFGDATWRSVTYTPPTAADGETPATEGTAGLVPVPTLGETPLDKLVLRADGTWAPISVSEIAVMQGAVAEDTEGGVEAAAGVAGLVPAPQIGDENKFLRGDGTWVTITADTTEIEEKVEKIEYLLTWQDLDTIPIDGDESGEGGEGGETV